MSVRRDDPYLDFNYLVDLGTGDPAGPAAGFSEVVVPSISIDVVEYRSGNERENSVRKLPGLQRVSNAVLKRGIIGDLGLYQWIREIATGQFDRRTVTITLLNESRDPVMAWKLLQAWPCKLIGPTLRAGASEVAIETLELCCRGVEIE
jgi:phage tail-like protein